MPCRKLLPVAAALALAACGGGSIPSGDPPPGGAGTLAPLGTGATWRYEIDDPLRGKFEKVVQVVGPRPIPDSTASAILVVDTEPTQEERAWLVEKDGFVLRAREEDWKTGETAPARVTTWSPAAPKTLSVAAPVGYTYTATVTESEWSATDGITGVKDQVYRFTVLAKDVPLTVQGRTYTCLQVKRERVDKLGDDRIYWLAPDVGKVREEGERIEQLLEYTPAP